MFVSLVMSAVMAVGSSKLMMGGAAVSPAPTARQAPVARPLSTPQFRRFGIADGLPGGQVYAATQDKNGLMWFASAGGLIRYDGMNFKTFRHVTDDPESLPFNAIYTLLVDRGNTIWAGGISDGLIAYDQVDGHFRHWVHSEKQSASLSSNEVWSIAQTAEGLLWIATEAGLDRMRPDGSGFDHELLVIGGKAESFGAIRALLAESDGRLWIAAQTGIYLRQPNGEFQRVPVDPSFHGDIGRSWSLDGGHGVVRVSLSDGLLVIGADDVAHPLGQKSLSSSRVLSSVRDTHGRLWIGKADGLVLSAEEGMFQTIRGHPLLSGGLPGSKIWHTMVDRQGGLWVTFEESAIAYLPPDWDGFNRYTHIPDDADSLSNIATSTIKLSHDGKLWVGGDDGWIDKLDVSTGHVQHVVKGIRGQVAALAEDHQGRLWIDVPGGLQVFDRGELKSVDIKRDHMTRPVLLAAGSDRTIYAASWGEGIFAIDPDSRRITPVPMDAEAGLAKGPLLPSQLSIHAGDLWYASAAGLMRLDRGSGKLMFVPGVNKGDVLAFDFDHDGFWLATEQVLEHYVYANGNARRDQVENIGKKGQISDLKALRVDRQGGLWLFANPGLWRFDKTTHRFTAFGPAQGLSNPGFGSGVTEIGPDGMIFTPDSSGVTTFQPKQLLSLDEHEHPAPPLSLTRLEVRRGDVTHVFPLNSTAPVQLGWRDRDLKVGARLASYINPAANRYCYQLSNFDSGWVDVGSRGEREFAGLGAGQYTLQVMAADAYGQWSRLAVPLTINVQAPPWQRWWAWSAYLLLLAALVGVGLIGWRRRLAQGHHIQMVEQQRQMAETASAAKTQFLATLSHEIRTPMTGVMGMAELLLSTQLNPLQRDYTRAMQRSGGMLLKLLNDALDLARIEAGRLELEPAPFDPRQMLDDVAQLEQGLAKAKGIRFVLDAADDLPAQVIGDAVRIKQVLLNLASNALKFTERGNVTLHAQRSADGLVISVSDTGPGIPEASQARLFQRFEQAESPQRRAGSGLGLAICRELVDMMGGASSWSRGWGMAARSTYACHWSSRRHGCRR
ncbi:MAG: two-component regulator propeller domain-containing protein [Rhodanobacter sp.]